MTAKPFMTTGVNLAGAPHGAKDPKMPKSVDYYFSCISPWAYLGHSAFMAVAQKHGLEVVYKPLALSRLFPESGGLPLSKRHPMRQAYRIVELQRWRERRQMSFNLQPKFWPFDPTLADRVVIALAGQGLAEKFLPQALAGVFANEQNLADETVVADMLAGVGLDAKLWIAEANGDATAKTYEANLADGMTCGVFGSPAYVLDGEVYWGQDRIDFLDAALASGRKAYVAAI